MEQIISKRIILRPFDFDDLDDFHELAIQKEVGHNAGWKPHTSMVESLEVMKMMVDDEWTQAICERATGKVIGSISIQSDRLRFNPKAQVIGYSLNQKYWGQGIMVEAVEMMLFYLFEILDVDIVTIYHFVDNARSKRVIEKCHFVFEGVLRQQYLLYSGEVKDSASYSMLKNEYYHLKSENRFASSFDF